MIRYTWAVPRGGLTPDEPLMLSQVQRRGRLPSGAFRPGRGHRSTLRSPLSFAPRLKPTQHCCKPTVSRGCEPQEIGWRESATKPAQPFQMATCCALVRDDNEHRNHEGTLAAVRFGGQARGSKLELLQMIAKRRRRVCRHDDEGPAIAGCPAELVVPVVGHGCRESARERRSSGFRGWHRCRLAAGPQGPGDALWQAHRPPRSPVL